MRHSAENSQARERRSQVMGIITRFAMAALFACGLPFSGCIRKGKTPAGPPTPEVATITIVPQEVLQTTELPGRTSAYRIAEIRPQVNGLIQKRLFKEGSDVIAGEELYQIDPAPYEAALDNASAALGRSEGNLPAIRSKERRMKELLAARAVSQQDYDDANSALKQAEADVLFWKAMVETARINLGYTKITAPISGRIGMSSVTDGAIVTAYQPMALASIQQLDPIYVDVTQSTAALLRLKRRLAGGMLAHDVEKHRSVQLILEDGGVYSKEGTLQFQDITVDPTTGSVTVRVVFPNPDGVLLPGMFVRAVVMEGVNEKAILVPQQAVLRNPKGEPFAWIVDAEGKAQSSVLTIDRAVGDQWLVNSGLAAGDKVIFEGLQRVRPGGPVKAVPAASPKTGATPVNTPVAGRESQVERRT